MSTKKSAVAAKTSKKTAARPAATHPSWIEMIKECIAASPDDSRQGVSRPHIKKYVEEQYNLQIGNAQNTQLARAIATGAEKGIFVLPKGPAGKVKLPPKNARPADTSASKENKPAKAVAPKPVTKARPAKAASTKAVAAKSAKKPVTKSKAVTTGAKAAAPKKVSEKKSETTKVSKAAAAKAPKKVLAGKKPALAKKTTTPSKRGAAKKAVTGTSAPAKVKTTAAKNTPTSRKAPASKKVPSKRASAKSS